MTLSSNVDLKSVYRPPSTLQLPSGGHDYDVQEAGLSQPDSMTSSSSQSSIGSTHGIQPDLAGDCASDAAIAAIAAHRSEVVDLRT